MNPESAKSKHASVICWSTRIRSRASVRLLVPIVLLLGFALPVRSFAQTTALNLGAAGQFNIFEVSNPNASSQSISISGSSMDGSVALGANTQYSTSSTSIGGSVYEDKNVKGTSTTTTVAGGVYTGVSLGSAGATAISQASTAAGENGGQSNNSFTQTGSNYAINSTYHGVALAVSVVDFKSDPNLQNSTITITGNANQQFVFNFSNGLSLTNTTIILSGGVTSNNIFFNITGGNVSISGSTLQGTFLDMVAKGSTPSMTLAHDTIHGSIVTDASLTMTSSVIAPELPTITMAAIACLVLLGKAGVDYRRRLVARMASATSQP